MQKADADFRGLRIASLESRRADDMASLGFGQGFALAEDYVCTVVDQIIKVRSERSRYLGAGPGGIHLDSDFGYLHLGLRAAAEADWQTLPQDVRELLTKVSSVEVPRAREGSCQLADLLDEPDERAVTAPCLVPIQVDILNTPLELGDPHRAVSAFLLTSL